MTDNRGVFTLRKIIEDRVPLDRWVDLQEVWVNSQDDSESLRFNDNFVSYNTGYFGGGGPSTPSVKSTMDKLSYASDTTVAVPGANLSSARKYLAATGNSIHGYFGGGVDNDGDPVSTMDKLSYSDDTRSVVPATGSLSSSRYGVAATGNSTAGYFGGGQPGPVSTMDKLSYSDDTRSTLPSTGSLSSARSELAATGNLTTGYFGGGVDNDGDPRSTMDKLSYSDDTRSVVPATGSLSSIRQFLAATGNSTAGYFGGGQPGPVATMDKLSYSTDTRSTLPASGSLSEERYGLAATGNSIHGYFGGGVDNDGDPRSTMDKLSYSDDTRSVVPGANLSSSRYGVVATSSRANALPQPLPPTPTPGPSIV